MVQDMKNRWSTSFLGWVAVFCHPHAELIFSEVAQKWLRNQRCPEYGQFAVDAKEVRTETRTDLLQLARFQARCPESSGN